MLDWFCSLLSADKWNSSWVHAGSNQTNPTLIAPRVYRMVIIFQHNSIYRKAQKWFWPALFFPDLWKWQLHAYKLQINLRMHSDFPRENILTRNVDFYLQSVSIHRSNQYSFIDHHCERKSSNLRTDFLSRKKRFDLIYCHGQMTNGKGKDTFNSQPFVCKLKARPIKWAVATGPWSFNGLYPRKGSFYDCYRKELTGNN